MVSETQKKNKFSIERFESVMNIVGVEWKELANELNYRDIEAMFKNKTRPPMNNIVTKACDYLGLKNTDYVMMNSNDFKIKNVTYNHNNVNKVYVKDIDSEAIIKYIEDSEWSYASLSTLLSINNLSNKCSNFFKDSNYYISNNDLNTLCWAIKCSKNDVCYNINDKDIPNRSLNDNQKYILNTNLLNSLKEIDEVLKNCSIPSWFINSSSRVYVSSELLIKINKAVFIATNKYFTFEELCNNSDSVEPVEFPKPNKRGRRISDSIKSEIIALLKENKTYKEIIEKTGVSHGTIENIKKKCLNNDNKNNEKPKTNKVNKKEKETMNIPNEVKEAVELNEGASVNTQKEENTIPSFNKYYKSNNKSFMEDVLYKIDRMTEDELDKVEKYIKACKTLKQYRNELLK